MPRKKKKKFGFAESASDVRYRNSRHCTFALSVQESVKFKTNQKCLLFLFFHQLSVFFVFVVFNQGCSFFQRKSNTKWDTSNKFKLFWTRFLFDYADASMHCFFRIRFFFLFGSFVERIEC